MASEIEWHKRSGKSVLDGFGRSLARRGLDILDMTGVTTLGEYQHSSRQLIDGVIRNRVEESLGAAKFEKICKQRTVLEHIHYCQSGPSSLLLVFVPIVPSRVESLQCCARGHAAAIEFVVDGHLMLLCVCVCVCFFFLFSFFFPFFPFFPVKLRSVVRKRVSQSAQSGTRVGSQRSRRGISGGVRPQP